MKGKAILFSEMTPTSELEHPFNEWYDREHIPIRMGLRGFESARRYMEGERHYLAVYEMTDKAALKTEAYSAIKNHPSPLTARMLGSVGGFTRYIGEEIGCDGDPAGLDAAVLYSVTFDVPAEACEEFDRWYAEDHVPTLLRCPQWRMVRRFAVIDGSPKSYTRLALHYLDDAAALNSPERAEARASPWRARLAAHEWFKGDYSVFNAVRPRQRSISI